MIVEIPYIYPAYQAPTTKRLGKPVLALSSVFKNIKGVDRENLQKVVLKNYAIS